MKRIFALLLAVVMVFGLVACSGSTTTTGNTTTTGKTETPTTGKTETPTTGNEATEPEETEPEETEPEETEPEETEPDPTEPEIDYNTVLAGDYGKITLWVSESEGVKEQFESQIAAFQTKYPNIQFTFEINVISEADAATQVITDVASAPDIYCFAQDQLTRLVQSAALSAPSGVLIDSIKALNSSASVSAASVAGTLYAYPMTADNGFYMYYDTSILSEEDVEDLATIVEKVEASGKKIRFALENAWYNAAFFYATGCYSNWSMNDEGKWTGIDDTYNSENGLIAMKGMQILAKSSAYDSDADIFTDAAVIVTGTWNANAAAAHFGENLGATDLPSFTVGEESYHLSSYVGCKLMGVKPQSDVSKQNVLHLLAQYLTNEENQLARFNSFGWGPSNLAALADEAVQADISLQALNKQNEYAVAQGNINGSWWDIAKLLGANAKNATTEQELWDALKSYDDAVHAVLEKSEEELLAWGVIGNICGTNWDTDFNMTEQEDGSFLSNVLTLHKGEEFKVRQGGSWDVNYGQDGVAGGNNIVVENSGEYQVKLTIDGDNVSVELILIASYPDPTEPDPTEPDPTEPDPTESDPTEPDPTEPDPTEPDPTEPDPTEPDPTESEENLSAWNVVGNICGTNWDTDFNMTEQEDGSFLSGVLELHAGERFKVRQGDSWDVNYGANGEANGADIVVEEDGKYRVKLTIDGTVVTIELIPAE